MIEPSTTIVPAYLGQRWAVDTNFFPTSRSPERAELWEFHRRGEIWLARTDVLGTELLNTHPGATTLKQGEVAELSEYLGPWVLDHSRLDSAVLGTPGDQALLDDVVGVIVAGRTWATARPHDVRDAMHIAWATRYGFDGFITSDKDLLRRRDEFRTLRFSYASSIGGGASRDASNGS
jgi:hypothetical protein